MEKKEKTTSMEKACFISFDNVLCLHYEDLVFDESIFFQSLKDATAHLYSASYLNMPVYRYLIAIQEIGYPVILLSCANSKYLSLQKEWIKEHCRQVKFKDYIGVSSDKEKLDIIKCYRTFFNIESENILYIDNCCSIKEEMLQNSIKPLSPQLIANEMYAQLVEDTKIKSTKKSTQIIVEANNSR